MEDDAEGWNDHADLMDAAEFPDNPDMWRASCDDEDLSYEGETDIDQ